jgi:putative endonuclease
MDDRLLRHNSGRSKYTKFGIPWQLVYLEEFKNKTEAYRLELEIKKKKSRNYIERLIAR